MKYKGSSLIQKNSTTVKFQKGSETLEFVVSPLPLGWWQQMSAIGVSSFPEPKKVALTDSKGTVVRNKATGKAEVIDRVDDPEYKKQVALVTRRLRVLQLVTHLRDDPNVEFESIKPKSVSLEDWQIYADQLSAELEESSLTDDEIVEIINAGEQSGLVLDIERVADEALLTPTIAE